MKGDDAGGRRVGPSGRVLGLLLFAAAVVAVAYLIPVQAHDDGHLPPEGCTCHSEQPSPAVTVVVEGWPKEFTPDTRYTLNITATGDVAGTAGGFSMEVSKGHLESNDPSVETLGKEATHHNAKHRAWTVEWVAPPEDSGRTDLIVYVNLANGDGRDGEEDLWNVLELSAPEKAPEPPKPSTLVLSFAGENGTLAAGHNLTLIATLTNFTGVPIPRATVRFFENTSYGTLAIGENVTGRDGRAPINWTVVSACECRFFAHYDGSSRNLSSNATGNASITDPGRVFDSLYPPPPTHVFSSFYGVSASIIFVVVSVWATLAYAAFAALRVRSLGTPAHDGPRDLLHLLGSRQNKEERK